MSLSCELQLSVLSHTKHFVFFPGLHKSMLLIFKKLYLFIVERGHAHAVSVHVAVRRQLLGICSLFPPHVFLGLNSVRLRAAGNFTH